MKDKNRKKFISHETTTPSVEVLRGSESSARLPSNYSPPTLEVGGAEEFSSSTSFDLHWTVRVKVTLTRKQLCMLAGYALSEVAEKGLGLSDWMLLEALYSFLLGNKRSPYERRDSREFEVTLLLKIVLLSGTWLGLEEKSQLPEDIRQLLLSSRSVPSGRAKASWRSHWKLSKFFEFRSVPVESLFERQKGTIRYSSYCKGYGESSRMGRRQKTRPSAELDGEPVDLMRDQSVRLNLLEISQTLTAVLLEIKYSLRR